MPAATRKQGSSLDFQKVNQLLNVLLHLDSTTNLASILSAEGQIAFDTVLKNIKFFDGTNIQILATLADIANVGTVNKYAADITTTVNTALTVTHNLNTTDVIVQVKDSANNFIDCEIDITDANNITVTSNPALTSARVIVIG